jgi:hypothetical protein
MRNSAQTRASSSPPPGRGDRCRRARRRLRSDSEFPSHWRLMVSRSAPLPVRDHRTPLFGLARCRSRAAPIDSDRVIAPVTTRCSHTGLRSLIAPRLPVGEAGAARPSTPRASLPGAPLVRFPALLEPNRERRRPPPVALDLRLVRIALESPSLVTLEPHEPGSERLVRWPVIVLAPCPGHDRPALAAGLARARLVAPRVAEGEVSAFDLPAGCSRAD